MVVTVVVVLEWEVRELTEEDYWRATERIWEPDGLPGGCLSHTACGNGQFACIDLWSSEYLFRDYYARRILPVLAGIGAPLPARVLVLPLLRHVEG